MSRIHSAFFMQGSKAVNILEISHWWVDPALPNGPTLCVVMRGGDRITFDWKDGGGDAYASAKQLSDAISIMGRKPCPAP